MIHIKSDFRAIDREIDRITQRMPDAKMRAALDSVLNLGFKETQKAVHIETGSLKTSGKKGSKTSKVRKRWEGTIEYGGPSGGVHNPVDYAIYEKERDGTHDFMAPLYIIHPFFVAAIKKGLSK